MITPPGVWPCTAMIHDAVSRLSSAQMALVSVWAYPAWGDGWYNGSGLFGRQLDGAAALSARFGGLPIIHEGLTWERLRLTPPGVHARLYGDDRYHQSSLGAYLNALVTYDTLFDGAVRRRGAHLVHPSVDGLDIADMRILAAAVGAPLNHLALDRSSATGGVACYASPQGTCGQPPPMASPPAPHAPPMPVPSCSSGLMLGLSNTLLLVAVGVSSAVVGASIQPCWTCCRKQAPCACLGGAPTRHAQGAAVQAHVQAQGASSEA